LSQQSNKPDYGNWVSSRIIYFPIILGLTLLAAAFPFWILVIPSLLCFAVAAYFAYARHLFSPKGKDVQSQIWDGIVSNLDWNGQGKALDIGCGNGALTIKVAKKYPAAIVTGIDYWGAKWGYSKSACEANAKAEGVEDKSGVSESQCIKVTL
jgi:SAM-dependent methyltransferase